MSHVYVDVKLKGAKGTLELKRILVDTGASYTVLNPSVLEKIGALETPYTVDVELGDGRVVKAKVYAIGISIGDREGPTLCVSFKGAKPAVGVLTLEGLGLKVNLISGKLEATRPRGIAYYHGRLLL